MYLKIGIFMKKKINSYCDVFKTNFFLFLLKSFILKTFYRETIRRRRRDSLKLKKRRDCLRQINALNHSKSRLPTLYQ